MARDRVAKVLDLERSLEARGEEAAEWSDQRRKRGKNESVQLDGSDSKGDVRLLREEKEVR